MQISEWRRAIGDMVRDHMRSPELEHYFSVPMNKRRAGLMITRKPRVLVDQQKTRSFLRSLGIGDVTLDPILLFLQPASHNTSHVFLL